MSTFKLRRRSRCPMCMHDTGEEAVLFDGTVEYKDYKGQEDYFWVVHVDMNGWEGYMMPLADRDDSSGDLPFRAKEDNDFLFGIPKGTPVEIIVRVKCES